MRHHSIRLLSLSTVLGLLVLPACGPTDLAGDSEGEFRIVGTLIENACGAGYPVPEQLGFLVEVRVEPGTNRAYWKLSDGPLVDGTMGPEGFRFEEVTTLSAIAPEPDLGIVGCAVARTEVVAGVITGAADAGTDDAGTSDAGTNDAGDSGAGDSDAGDAGSGDAGAGRALSGTTTVTVSAVAGGDCSPLLAPNGGPFPVLPCAIRYALAGTPE